MGKLQNKLREASVKLSPMGDAELWRLLSKSPRILNIDNTLTHEDYFMQLGATHFAEKTPNGEYRWYVDREKLVQAVTHKRGNPWKHLIGAFNPFKGVAK